MNPDVAASPPGQMAPSLSVLLDLLGQFCLALPRPSRSYPFMNGASSNLSSLLLSICTLMAAMLICPAVE